MANGPALQNGTFDLARLLDGSSFTMALGAAEGRGSGPFGDLTFWGSGDYRSISGGSGQSVSYDGTVTSANLGIDTRLSADVLAGVSLTSSQGAVDYTDLNAQEGELSTSLTSVNPLHRLGVAGRREALGHGRLRHGRGGDRRRGGHGRERSGAADVRGRRERFAHV